MSPEESSASETFIPPMPGVGTTLSNVTSEGASGPRVGHSSVSKLQS